MTTKIPVELSSTPSIVDNGDATAITIDSSERVMIGTTDAGYPDFGDSLTLGDVDGGGGNAGMTIRSGTSSYGTFYFSDATGTAAGTYAGKMQYNHSTNSMVFATNSSDRLTIDSSGNVGIGTSSPIRPLHLHGGTSGDIVFAITNNSTGATTSDGFNIIIEGPTPDVLLRNRENSNMRFLTNNTERMRILSGGGLTFNGDTAAANALNDYEEGIHTVTMTDSGGGATITLNTSFNQISYTKIGRLVHVSGVLLPSAVSGSFTGTTNISLPFAGANLSDQAGKGFINVETYSVDFTAGTAPAGHIGEGIAAASILVSADNAAYGFARVNTSSQIYVGGTYITDA